MTTYKVNSKVRLNGLLLEENLFESVSDPNSKAGIFSCRVLPLEPWVVDDLLQAFREVEGPEVKIEHSRWMLPDGSIYCDSIIQPWNDFRIHPNDLTPHKGIRITFKPVVNYTPDQQAAFGQLQLIGFDPYVDPTSELCV